MVQHFRLVNYHFFYPAISIVLQFLHAEHGELATPLSRSLSHHGGLRETGALGDAGVSVPGGALGVMVPLDRWMVYNWENPGLYNGGFGGTNGYHYFRKPPYIYRN